MRETGKQGVRQRSVRLLNVSLLLLQQCQQEGETLELKFKYDERVVPFADFDDF